MFRSIGNPVGSLQLAKGRADLGFYWNLGVFLLTPLVIYLGSVYGLIGVAISLLSLQILLHIPNWYFMVRPLCSAGFKEYFNEIIIPLSTAVIASVIGSLVYYLSPIESVYVCSILFLFLALSILHISN
jgi:O-antigen/teichoic acid export membrane protein